ncbi:MAG TPA: type II toxin-antitoxin system VapC family toxin [Tepidisphaeraceae bacterium]|nr:type II toxin-antitoxin system VapC family toxin [Tepidisphaeraceae bacterium]
MIYIDTSVLAAIYIPERWSQAAENLLASQNVRVISNLVEVEMHSAVARRLRMREIKRDEASSIVRKFEADLESLIYQRLEIGEPDWAAAKKLLDRFDAPLRTLDALHLALALTNQLRLVTSDRRLAKSARSLKIDFQFLGA